LNEKKFTLTPSLKARCGNAREKNGAIKICGSVVITRGNISLTNNDGKEVMVDKEWEFKKSKDGKHRIIVHKSALPFSPTK
jgi:hypothetical protein